MKVYTYSEARQRLSEVLNIARTEEIVIKRRGGEFFSITLKKAKNPLLMYQVLIREQRLKTFLMQSRTRDREVDPPNHVLHLTGVPLPLHTGR